MIRLRDGNLLCETAADLPDLTNANEVFCDIESTSFDRQVKGFHPYQGHRIAGIAITADQRKNVWYVPIRHRGAEAPIPDTDRDMFRHMDTNLPWEEVKPWVHRTLGSCQSWVNHSVKFDAHFMAEDFGFEPDHCRLVDTLTQAKLLDSDRGYGTTYELMELCQEWLGAEVWDNRIKAFLKGIKVGSNSWSKDYGDLPSDLAGLYACNDVRWNRKLWRYIQRTMPEQLAGVSETEILLTPALFDTERQGMRVYQQELQIEELKAVTRLVRLEEIIEERTGLPEFNPNSFDQVYDLFVNRFGLPIVAYKEDSETGELRPTFNKDALKAYRQLPQVLHDENMAATVEAVIDFRHDAKFLQGFVRPYLQLADESSHLHPTYNQCVRTGRMSGRNPNPQQLNKRAKRLIHPDDGMAFLSCDYSQVEYRLIVHYIQDPDAIRAYNEDPNTDFHQWVADLCGIHRSPAKNVNFGMGYGMGKKRLIGYLTGNDALIEETLARMAELGVPEEDREDVFGQLIEERAQEVFATYHDRFPGIRRHSKRSASAARGRGYVFNAYGRRRHLPRKAAHIAFNSVIQSCAADIAKERYVALAPRYNKRIRDWGITQNAIVHDEFKFQGPIAVLQDPEVRRYIAETMEDTAIKFRVPIRTSMGYSEKDWAEASGKDGEVEIPRAA